MMLYSIFLVGEFWRRKEKEGEGEERGREGERERGREGERERGREGEQRHEEK
jgi:hypothetical protein